jgi:uncharacterized protein YjbI with pentapeptide repeats
VFDDVQLHATGLRGVTLSETTLTRVNAPVFAAPRAHLRNVSVEGSRLGSAEMYESALNSVRITGSKLGFVNLSGATLQDVLFEDCTIDELDLGGAKLLRVAFVGCTINTLHLAFSKLTHVDLRGAEFRRIDGLSALRGATLSSFQVAGLAESFAAELGIVVEG